MRLVSLPTDIHRLSLYFFLMLPDDEAARNAAKESFREYKRLATESRQEETNLPLLISSLHSTWLRFKRKFAKIKEPQLTGAGWILRDHWDLEPWLQFRKTAREEEVEAVLLGQVFSIPDLQIARALELSEGTVRARRLHGLSKLGNIIHQHKTRRNA